MFYFPALEQFRTIIKVHRFGYSLNNEISLYDTTWSIDYEKISEYIITSNFQLMFKTTNFVIVPHFCAKCISTI